MSNVNVKLVNIKNDTTNEIAGLRKKIYQMYPAFSIEDIEAIINQINSVESFINNAFTKSIRKSLNKSVQGNTKKRTYEPEKFYGLFIPF